MLVSCISACGRCRFCKEGRYGQCLGGGGWILGHTIDGLQAEYARMPFADNSLYKVPEGAQRRAGPVPRGHPAHRRTRSASSTDGPPGDVVAIVGAGPIGLAAILTAKLYTPGRIVAIDLADSRLASAREFGADTTINNGSEDAVARIMELTDGLGPTSRSRRSAYPRHSSSTELIRPGGRVANIGVHGHSATLHLEKLWSRDVTITTGLVDTCGPYGYRLVPPASRVVQFRRLRSLPVLVHGVSERAWGLPPRRTGPELAPSLVAVLVWSKNEKHCAMSSLAEPNERTLQALTAPVIAGLRLT